MRAWIVAILIVLLAAPVLGQQVVVNSKDWRDVYTGLQYASVEGMPAHFVINATQAQRLLSTLGGDKDVLLITGRNQAMPGFRAMLQSKGFTVNEYTSEDPIATNQHFATVANTTNLVVVDDAYGYNAISVATYAKMRHASVVFAHTGVQSIILEKHPQELLLYGHIPSSLYDTLSQDHPVVINKQDRFDDNFALVQRFINLTPTKALQLTNGEFIEQGLIMGNDPVLFIGRQNVPQDVLDFITAHHFSVAVLVGNSLAPNAKFIKDKTNISIFIKFAQGQNQQQYALDLFPVPIANPEVTIGQAQYDASQHALLVTYQNPGTIATYVTGSYSGPNGTVGDSAPLFLDAKTYKTVRYSMPDPGATLPYTLLYGASPNTLELIKQGNATIEHVTIDDKSNITIADASYDPSAHALEIQVKNTGTVDAYVLVEADNVRSGGELLKATSTVTPVAAGKTATLPIPLNLTLQDEQSNQEVSLQAFFGQRALSLVKNERSTLPFVVRTPGIPLWAILVAAAVALLLILYAVRKRR